MTLPVIRRILYHHRTQGRGVEATHILGIVRSWQNRGVTVRLVSPPGVAVKPEAAPRATGASLAGAFRVLSRAVPEIWFEVMELLYNLPACRRLSMEMKQQHYDCLYERYALMTWAGARAALRHSVPYYLEINYTSHSRLYRRRSRLLEPLAHRIDRYLFRNAAGLVAVSTALKEQLIELGVPAAKVRVLPNAADAGACRLPDAREAVTRELGLEGRRIIGFVGYFYPWHRLDLLLDAIPGLRKRMNEFAILLVGDGPARPELEKRVIAESQQDVVRFVGAVHHGELPRYLSCFDVAVVPHSNDYGSPMKVFEYMAAGIPVVAPDLGPLRDAMTSGVEGLLFKPLDVCALRDGLVALLTDDGARSRMGQAGRRNIETTHNWGRNADILLQYFSATGRAER